MRNYIFIKIQSFKENNVRDFLIHPACSPNTIRRNDFSTMSRQIEMVWLLATLKKDLKQSSYFRNLTHECHNPKWYPGHINFSLYSTINGFLINTQIHNIGPKLFDLPFRRLYSLSPLSSTCAPPTAPPPQPSSSTLTVPWLCTNTWIHALAHSICLANMPPKSFFLHILLISCPYSWHNSSFISFFADYSNYTWHSCLCTPMYFFLSILLTQAFKYMQQTQNLQTIFFNLFYRNLDKTHKKIFNVFLFSTFYSVNTENISIIWEIQSIFYSSIQRQSLSGLALWKNQETFKLSISLFLEQK